MCKKPIRVAWYSLLPMLALLCLLGACDTAGSGSISTSQATMTLTIPPQSSTSTPARMPSASTVSSMPVLPLRAIRMLDTRNGWALTTSSILKTTDGGRHWQDVTPSNAGLNASARGQFMNMQDAWIVIGPANQQEGSGIPILRTIDGGMHWQQSMINDPLVSLVDVPHFLSVEEGWLALSGTPGAGSAGTAIWHSNDGGQTWIKLSSNKNSSGLELGYVTGISFRDAQTGIAAGNLGAGGDNTFPSLALTKNGGQI